MALASAGASCPSVPGTGSRVKKRTAPRKVSSSERVDIVVSQRMFLLTPAVSKLAISLSMASAAQTSG